MSRAPGDADGTRNAAEHEYVAHPDYEWWYCRVCGLVRRRDGVCSPCKGPARLRPFEPMRPVEEPS